MTDTPTEVEKVSTLGALIQSQASEFAKVLPAHVGEDRFARWSLSMLRKALSPTTSPKQREAWETVLGSGAGQASVMQALLDCASLGLEPGRTYHLVPYGGQVTGITDYKGEIELIYRAGQHPVIASLVREADQFYMLGANVPPKHEADWFADRGAITGGYAYCQLGRETYSMVVSMSEADFEHHKAMAKTPKVWDEWPEAMRLKTLVHQLRKFVPWSAEVRP